MFSGGNYDSITAQKPSTSTKRMETNCSLGRRMGSPSPFAYSNSPTRPDNFRNGEFFAIYKIGTLIIVIPDGLLLSASWLSGTAPFPLPEKVV